MGIRVEEDLLGRIEIPRGAYYGNQTQRAYNNFKITSRPIHRELIMGLAMVKKAAAYVNYSIGILDEDIKEAITKACDEILEGKLHDQFIVDAIQGGAGTSMNMNANEVIANRAAEILGGAKGDYKLVSPNDHVNECQSTNDVVPTAGKIATINLLHILLEKLDALKEMLIIKATEFDDVIKMGRTQLQDAAPMRLGQEFKAYSSAIERDITRIKLSMERIKSVNLGGTVIGTGLNAHEEYVRNIVPKLNKVSGIDLKQADDLIGATQNADDFVDVSAAIRVCAVNLSKMANDLRLLSSGPKTGIGEIHLPAKQAGSSIVPGKVNPVIPEVVNQIAFNVIGNDVTITMAAEAGQLELNAFLPIVFYKLFESIETLITGIETFLENCLRDIMVDKDRCRSLVDHSLTMVTALSPHIGYENATKVSQEALKKNRTIREIVLREELLNEERLDEVLEPYKMTKPGIIGGGIGES
ncbi:MAG: aspartate ammonia-lyase [Clostridiales bacterium]|nr:aspartate ammonia-lyase [Clostridiales bacterium]